MVQGESFLLSYQVTNFFHWSSTQHRRCCVRMASRKTLTTNEGRIRLVVTFQKSFHPLQFHAILSPKSKTNSEKAYQGCGTSTKTWCHRGWHTHLTIRHSQGFILAKHYDRTTHLRAGTGDTVCSSGEKTLDKEGTHLLDACWCKFLLWYHALRCDTDRNHVVKFVWRNILYQALIWHPKGFWILMTRVCFIFQLLVFHGHTTLEMLDGTQRSVSPTYR